MKNCFSSPQTTKRIKKTPSGAATAAPDGDKAFFKIWKEVFMKICRSTVSKVTGFLFTISSILLGGVTLLTFINSVLRRFFSTSLVWSEELSTYCIVLALFLSLASLELRDEQLCIGIMNNIIKNKIVLKCLFILRGVVTAAICFLVGMHGLTAAQAAARAQLQTFILRWPLAALYYITVGAFWLAVVSWITIFINKGEKVV